MNVYYPCSTKTILRRQGACDDINLISKARINHLAKAAYGLRNNHAIHAILQISVIAAHMHLTKTILHNAGRLQQHLVEWRGVALR